MRTVLTALSGLVLLAALAGAAQAQAPRADRAPYLGYAYPAGGRQGTSFQVTVGGQFLQGTNNIWVSGEGVSATVVEYVPPLGRLKPEQLQEVGRRIREAAQKLLAAQGRPAAAAALGGRGKEPKAGEAPVVLPEHPLLRDIDKLSLSQLKALGETLKGARKKFQMCPQLAEMVTLRVTIDPTARPGDRELRLSTPAGLTNPICFQVGTLGEASEQEPNTRQDPAGAVVDTPVVLNGQILPGDVDCFRLRARQGQKLVLQAQARRLIPYLADGVPGWFQALLALYDAKGNQVAYADDYRGDPDPVLLYAVPADGEYTLEIRDSIYRGREDFVYRITAGEVPFITELFPLGGRVGEASVAAVKGWNLPNKQVQLDTTAGGEAIRASAWTWNGAISNRLPYAVDALPETTETEPNDTNAAAQRSSLPVIVNGRLGKPGDVDVYRIEGQAGQEVVAEVQARRLGSPLDSLLRLTDATGKVLAWNDDTEDPTAGLVTHQADSYLRVKLPAAGVYYLQLSDAERHGGEEYAYRLRLSAPQPDFAVRLAPASVSVPAGRTVSVTAYVVRKDGFGGDLEVALSGAANGFSLGGGRIPAGRDQVTMTLTGPTTAPSGPVALHLEARATIDGRAVTRAVVPAAYMMQAFAYHHLVPAQELLVQVTPGRRFEPYLQLASGAVTRIPAGGGAQVQVRTTAAPWLQGQIRLELQDPPAGMSLGGATTAAGGWALTVQANARDAKVGYADNLIVEAFAQVPVKNQRGAATGETRRVSLGILPAIPFEIVAQ